MSLTTTCLIALGVLVVGVSLGVLQARRVRARGERVSAVISSNVAFGSVLIVVLVGLLISRAFNK